MTRRSPGSRSSMTPRATPRSRRATWWRWTAFPTDFDTTRPILGAISGTPTSSTTAERRECTTKSGWTARTPRLTVSPKSVDRVIRYWAGSTALDPAANHAVRELRPLLRRADTMARPARVRIRSRKPCTRARRRLLGWKVRLPLATAITPRSCGGTHHHVSVMIRAACEPRRVNPKLRVAAVSPRSGDCSRVLTRFP